MGGIKVLGQPKWLPRLRPSLLNPSGIQVQIVQETQAPSGRQATPSRQQRRWLNELICYN